MQKFCAHGRCSLTLAEILTSDSGNQPCSEIIHLSTEPHKEDIVTIQMMIMVHLPIMSAVGWEAHLQWGVLTGAHPVNAMGLNMVLLLHHHHQSMVLKQKVQC